MVEEFRIDSVRVTEPLDPDYNVAPTKPVYAVVERRRDDRTPERQLRVVRWGLVPSWAKDVSIGSRLINARIETAAVKPSFRRALAVRRCLLPADGYYEWYVPSADARRKQPFFIRPKTRSTLPMAGLYEIWCDPERPEEDPARFVWSCAILTTQATDDLGRVHDRMPFMVEPDRWSAWLDPRSPADAVRALLTPAAPGVLEAYPVGSAVGNVRNNGPELIEPIAAE